jgi:LacI family transcriptional regulator
MKFAASPKIPRIALLIESSRTYGRGILRGIARYAHVHGPWSFFTMERDLHGGVPTILKKWKGDGIIARIENRGMAAKLRKLGCPVIDVLGQAALLGVPSFDTDAAAVAQMAVNFFQKAGFQHFAYAGYPGIPFSEKRRVAFARFLQEHGHSLRVLPHAPVGGGAKHIQAIEQEGISAEGAIARWLQAQPRPLAVLACNDVRAQQVLNACREHGLRVPDQIAVMGVDNDDVLCALCEPPLSSIEPDAERLGYEAAELLARMIKGHGAVPANTQIPPARLIERVSTDFVAIEDPITVQAVRFIRDNIDRGIAVKDVTAHVQRSRTDLEQRFRRALKRSVRAEILRCRMDRVCALLRQTKLSLNEVAQRTGFSSAAHVCRLFHQRYKLSPTDFRKQV